MMVYIVCCYDRHVGTVAAVHRTRQGADGAIEEFKKTYNASAWTWTEEDYGRAQGWVRYVSSGGGDGPNAYIQETELKR